jgi:single-stranded-DNA-specific exonuclease
MWSGFFFRAESFPRGRYNPVEKEGQMARARTQKRWVLAPEQEGIDALARDAGTTPIAAQVLWNRGLRSADAIREFLRPQLNNLHDPELLSGAATAARRIVEAVHNNERIIIYGDYDVDGMTSVAILDACLKLADANVDFYVPHRLEEGYGLHAGAAEALIERGVDLVVTVDCGIGSHEVVNQFNAAGVDVIITDHHVPPEVLPAAVAIVHPDLPGQEYPNPVLAGAGVAYKLAWQVSREICGSARVDDAFRQFLMETMALAALGTIADSVPLVGENRTLTVFGLDAMTKSGNRGIDALLASAGREGKALTTTDVSFGLAPRLNAAGRMGHADQAIELLIGDDPARCRELAEHLEAENVRRQKVEQEITAEAVEMVCAAGMDDPSCPAIVLANEGWHGGVIGIVASRMVERFSKPTIMIAINGDGIGQGSGRSIAGFDLQKALLACKEHLQSCGGHAMAAGLKVDRDKIATFAEAFGEHARGMIREEDVEPRLLVDAEVSLAGLSYMTVEHLTRMAPFGQGNAEPVIALHGCRIVNPPKRMGKRGNHVSMMLTQGKGTIRAVGFNMGSLVDSLVGVTDVDVAATPTLNTFNGRTSVELHLKDVHWQ